MESQNTEWKESWRDEYLKGICAFANAQGGILEIGKDDKGRVVGVHDAKKLLQDLPNKIRQAMGIIADVDLLSEGGLDYIHISVKPYPISCRGKYYRRSGSTTQELSGYELDGFMLQKQGKTWDSVPVPYVKAEDLDIAAFRAFRKKALASGRLSEEDLSISDELLLKNLRLMEGDYITRAAVLLFHEDPEKYIFGSYVKIGYFENDAEIRYQDEIHGPLILMPDKVLETIELKYFKGIISYKGITRVETYPVPREAIREAILNAIVHRDYSTYNPIHIRVYDNKVRIDNDGKLPNNWTVEDLMASHPSMPYNPLIASTFFRTGSIEIWGRGVERIISACTREGKPSPDYTLMQSSVMVTFCTGEKSGYSEDDCGINVGINVGINETQSKILDIMREEPGITAHKIAELLGISRRRVESNIHTLKALGKIVRIGANRNGKWLVR
ncbi:MAG: putative DNA binding domain-containing protein [Desulfovibrio sp.]|nr:putative DNA binding domain-containing protein [Desulfovibrio sp.]